MELNQMHYIEPRDNRRHLDLGGCWNYGYFESESQHPENLSLELSARIPNSIYWNLYESGVLPHPYIGTNSKQYHWVDEKVWYYRKRFTANTVFRGDTAILCLDGTAYYSRVWLNGTLLGDHEGMFGGPYVNVSENLVWDGENELTVEIKAHNYGKKQEYDGWNAGGLNREILPWNIARDSRTSNGDFVVMGLWKDVRIEFLSPVHLSRPYLVTQSAEESRAKLRLEAEIISEEVNELSPGREYGSSCYSYTFAYSEGMLEAWKDTPASLRVTVREKTSGTAVYDKVEPIRLLDYAKSLLGGEFREGQFTERELEIEDPKLWYPHDMGEPFLYTVRLELTCNGKVVDELEFDYGIRTVTTELSAGHRTRQRWEKFQFVVNGKKVFIKGVNWMPQDILYKLDPEEYAWSLTLVKNAGIHLIRIWSGGGMPESNAFYHLCDEMGIMVWQDHFIANTENTFSWPQDVLEAQECVNLFRIRNHPSLVLHCGGNEFNPYTPGNAASMFVIERAVRTVDPSRIFHYTTPDKGSAHIYRDMEPTWYRHCYKNLPFIAESGIHSLPSFKALGQFISEDECKKIMVDMTSPDFRREFPELLNHFAEYVPERVPRMLARASQIDDLKGMNLEKMCEATQMASCEFYLTMIQSARENYPVTTGIMPWVFRRTWTTVGIQLVDGYGQPIPPYYYLKTAYKNVTVSVALEHLSYAPGETVKLPLRILSEYGLPLDGMKVRLSVLSPDMKPVLEETLPACEAEGAQLAFKTGEDYAERFFFVTATLTKDGEILSRSVYWPKCLNRLRDPRELEKYRSAPQENFNFKTGPWLKKQVASCRGAELKVSADEIRREGRRTMLTVLVENVSDVPAFPVCLSVTDGCVRDVADDNYFWLDPGEKRTIRMVADSVPGADKTLTLKATAWNCPEQIINCSEGEEV